MKEQIPFEKLMRKFKKMCERNRIMEEVKSRQAYIKPSMKKRLKRIRAQRKAKNG